MALSHEAARRVYDRIGRAQDWQAFYERRPVEELLAHGAFEDAHAVLEFGFGTGRVAADLLSRRLRADATYVGLDISPAMQRIARERLAPWGGRARLLLTGGSPAFPLSDRSCDRLISTYTLDLLGEDDQSAFMEEAWRVLGPDGRLCLSSIAAGTGGLSAVVSRAWHAIWRRMPELVGGCRPIRVAALLDDRWEIDYRARVRAWGVTSELLVARRAA